MEGGYTIRYKARPKSEEFLNTLSSQIPEGEESNADFHYMAEAYDAVDKWLNEKPEESLSRRQAIANALFRKEEKNAAKIIWYAAPEDSNEENLFTRLNDGKIPLTNSELIKAQLVLNAKQESGTDGDLAQRRVAEEWVSMSRRLQDDSFWYFFSTSSKSNRYGDKRIEYILSLAAEKEGDDFRLIEAFRKDPNTLWSKAKRIMWRLEEWYANREVYHYVGYLAAVGELNLPKLLEQAKKSKKSEIGKLCKKNIAATLKGINLDELSYGNGPVKEVLLLFSVLEAKRREKYPRFDFASYRTTPHDIEHIRPYADDSIDNREEWCEMLKEYLKSLGQDGKSLIEKIDSWLKSKDEDVFGEIYAEAYELLDAQPGEREFNQDELGNLTLLCHNINRGYKNAFFAVKRYWIQSDTSSYIPISTRDTFLKAYTRNPKTVLRWAAQDAEDYQRAICETVGDFLQKNKK